MAVTFEVLAGGLNSLRVNVVVPWARQRAEAVERCATDNAPVDTGELVDSIGIEGPISSGSRDTFAVVASAPHAIFVHEGTRFADPQPFLADCLHEAIP